MLRSTWARAGRMLALAAVAMLVAGAAMAVVTEPVSATETARAAWLLQRDAAQTLALTGEMARADDFGGGAASGTANLEGRKHGGALPVLASLVLPGAGEAMLGHKRGFVMMALDIFAWTRVAKYHNDGRDLSSQYYAYADEHYNEDWLLAAYQAGGSATDGYYRAGIGAMYFDFGTIETLPDLDKLPLYVTVGEDRREYYENLGKWEQFVFGWDDFTRPDDPIAGYTPTWNAKTDLDQPFVSEHRDIYRQMRADANDAYKTRDRWLYVNIGLRVFSVLQTAYFDGLLGGNGGGDGDDRVTLGGHEIKLIAQPTGLRRAVVAASVSF